MAARDVKVPIIDDVTDDEELIAFFNTYRKLFNFLTVQLSLAATQIKAMLRVYDKAANNRRAHKVSRPMALAAGMCVGAAKLCAMAAKRFQVEYEKEIAMARHKRRASSRFRFGDGD